MGAMLESEIQPEGRNTHQVWIPASQKTSPTLYGTGTPNFLSILVAQSSQRESGEGTFLSNQIILSVMPGHASQKFVSPAGPRLPIRRPRAVPRGKRCKVIRNVASNLPTMVETAEVHRMRRIHHPVPALAPLVGQPLSTPN